MRLSLDHPRWTRLLEQRIVGLPAPILIVIAYFLAQAVLLSLIRNGASYDGSEQLITSQGLEWGYGRSQPPLYTWLLVAIETVVRAPLLAEHLLKATLFIAGYTAIYATARRIGLSTTAPAAAMFSTFLLPEIGWQAQTAYTHSALVFATGALLLRVFVGLSEESSTWQHLAFGALAALTLLSKFSAAFLILAMVAALVWERRFTPIFAKRKALAGLAVFFLILGPHLVWSALHPELLFALSNRLGLDDYRNPLVERAVGLATYLTSVAIFIAALAVTAILLAYGGRRAATIPPAQMRVIVTFVAGLFVMALVPLLSGASDFAPRWPLAAAFPFAIVAVIVIEQRRPQRLPALALIGLVAAGAYLVGINARSALPDQRYQIDYARLLADIEAQAGPRDAAVITDYPTLASLRVARPAFRLIAPEFPFTQRFAGRRTTYLWTGDGGPPPGIVAAIAASGRSPADLASTEITVWNRYGSQTDRTVHAAW